jgi:hypothetical protein
MREKIVFFVFDTFFSSSYSSHHLHRHGSYFFIYLSQKGCSLQSTSSTMSVSIIHQQPLHRRRLAALSSAFSYYRTALLLLLAVAVATTGTGHMLLVTHAMRLSSQPSSFPSYCRARFLSSTAAAFVASATVVLVTTTVGANDVCEAAAAASCSTTLLDNDGQNTKSSSSRRLFDDNPRYIDKELQMKYGEGPGKHAVLYLHFFVSFFLAFCAWFLDDDEQCKLTHSLTYTKHTIDGNPRTRGILVRRFTGDATPYEFPVRPIRLQQDKWPRQETPPFQREDFFRTDNNRHVNVVLSCRFVPTQNDVSFHHSACLEFTQDDSLKKSTTSLT